FRTVLLRRLDSAGPQCMVPNTHMLAPRLLVVTLRQGGGGCSRLLLVMAKLAKLVDRRGSHLEHRFGIIDGKTLMIH
ncbi:hypothetical protein L915_07000, partial [Phytophthora nicotianae]